MSNKLTDDVKRSIRRKLMELLERSAAAVKHDIPEVLNEQYRVSFYYGVIDPDVSRAMKLLNTHASDVVEKTTTPSIIVNCDLSSYAPLYELSLPKLAEVCGSYMQIKLPDAVVGGSGYRATEVPRVRADYEGATALEAYCRDAVLQILKTKMADAFIRDFLDHANTPGQILRLWPDVQPFLSQGAQEILVNAVRRSRLPRGFVLSDNWIAKRNVVTQMLATGALLPADSRVGLYGPMAMWPHDAVFALS